MALKFYGQMQWGQLGLVCLVMSAIGIWPQAVAIEAQTIQVLEPQASVQGQPIPIFRYGTGHEEYVFLLAGFHGNEPQGPFMLEQMMQVLAKNPGYALHKSIFVMPRVNPDGLRSQRRTNANHVDLNRNFPTLNFMPNAHKGTAYYAGPAALSEPESQVIHELLSPFIRPESKHKVKILTIHAPYAVNNYDGPARALAERMRLFNQYPVSADIGYPTPGSFGSYYGKEKGLRVVTLETDNGSPQSAWQRHEKALLAFLQFPHPELSPPPVPAETELQPRSPNPPGPTPVPGGVEAFLREQAQKP